MSKCAVELENMFNEYSRSLRLVWPDAVDTFVCPLCMHSFERKDISSGKLSLEHVPPKSIKSVCKTITCAHCNNTVGTKLQRFMANDASRKELEAGKELRKPLRAKVQTNECVKPALKH